MNQFGLLELENTYIQEFKRQSFIKKILKNIFRSNSPAVLYGGSVDGNNVKCLKKLRN